MTSLAASLYELFYCDVTERHHSPWFVVVMSIKEFLDKRNFIYKEVGNLFGSWVPLVS